MQTHSRGGCVFWVRVFGHRALMRTMNVRLLLTCAAICSISMLRAQEAYVSEADTVKRGVHPYREEGAVAQELSNWVLFLDAGGNIFDGDFSSEMAHPLFAPTVGLGFTYNFNTGWGIGAEYLYSMYGVTGKKGGNNADKLLRGQLHRASGFLTFDIFNVWEPAYPNKLFALNLMVGAGMGWFKRGIYYPASDKYPASPKGGTALIDPSSDDKFQNRSFLLGGVDFQFNVSRSISIGFKGVYNFFTKDDLDGRYCGNNNDGVFDLTLSLRYKIDAQKKSHVCNATSKTFLADVADDNRGRGNGGAGDGGSGDDNGGSGAGDGGALRPCDTVIIYQSDTVIINNTIVNNLPSETEYYVYFDNDEYALTDEALQIIQQLASRLERDTSIYIEVIGSCDNTGSKNYNHRLGQNRADRVMDELMAEYGIDSTRMVGHSKGILFGRRSTASYSPNRRVAIRLLTKEHFDEVKKQIEEERKEQEQTYEEAVKTASETTQGKTVVLEPGMTLGRLSQREYGNAAFWIYIYEANKSKIADPDNVRDGIELFVPELTEAQRAAVMPSRYKRK